MIRVGIGYDVHRTVAGRDLVLGGVKIPCDFGLDGHSDADVLSHAVADALLGAAGERDIGHHFPNSDPSLAGMCSLRILQRVQEILYGAYFEILNVDATLVAEAPRIGPHLDAMRAKMADALGILPSQIGIKATTNETIGFIGRGEGIAAMATAALLIKS
jgi:2-C-methyl-D-erythritol 2,4-cyclodiphosphate synthase